MFFNLLINIKNVKIKMLQFQISYEWLSFPLKNDPTRTAVKFQNPGDGEKVPEAAGEGEKSPTKKQG